MLRVFAFIVLVLIQSVSSALYGQSIITTIAGPVQGYSGDGGPATAAGLGELNSVFADAAGNVYLTDMIDNHVVRKINAATGIITTIAGTGVDGNSGNGGPATAARLSSPSGVYVAATGDIYVVDINSSIIRKIDAATGIINTVAGNGTSAYTGDGGPAMSASLWSPVSVTGDAAGNIYFTQKHAIRKIAAGTGIITTVAGGSSTGSSANGIPATAAGMLSPEGLCVDNSGNIYFADALSYKVRKVVASTGLIYTVAGNGVPGYAGDGGPATNAKVSGQDVKVDAGGNLYIADMNNNRIRTVSPDGTISTIVGTDTAGYSGDGGPATSCKLSSPRSIYLRSGNLYIADVGNNAIRKVTAVSGINDPARESQISIFPSPSHGNFSVELVTASTEQITLTVSDVSGKIIMQMPASTNKLIPVQLNAPSGLYVLSILGNATLSTKIYIVR